MYKHPSRMPAIIRLLRPKRWIKNLLVFIPSFFGGKLSLGSGMTFDQRDAHYKGIAIDWILEHPLRFLSLIPAKLFYFLATDTYGGNAFFSNEILTDNLSYYS